jgi:hypothetical protein
MIVLLTKCFNNSGSVRYPWVWLHGEYNLKYFGLLFLFAISGVVFTACSFDGGEAELRNRADLYWKYLSAGQTDLMYDMEYRVLRNQMDKNVYIRRHAPVVKYREPTIETVQIDKSGTMADLRIKVIASVRPRGTKKAFERPFSLNDRWVKADDGVWYHVPKSSVNKK